MLKKKAAEKANTKKAKKHSAVEAAKIAVMAREKQNKPKNKIVDL